MSPPGPATGLFDPESSALTMRPFSFPEAVLLFVSTKNRDLREGHGLPVTLRMLRAKSDNLIGGEHETNSLRMFRKLDLPRGRDFWC